MDLQDYLYAPAMPVAVVALVGAVRAEWPEAKNVTLVACSVVFGIALSLLFTSGHTWFDAVRAGVLYGLLASGSMHVVNFSIDKFGVAMVAKPMDKAVTAYSSLLSSIAQDAKKQAAANDGEGKVLS